MQKTNKRNAISEYELTLSSTITRIISKKRQAQRGENCFTCSDEIWVSTREMSDECDMDIYKVRYYLLKLEAHGVIIRRKELKKSACYWRPSNDVLPEIIRGHLHSKGV